MVAETQFGRGRLARWIVPIGILLIVLMVGIAVHVHQNDDSGATCVVCVSARSSAPTTVTIAAVLFIALATVLTVGEPAAPAFEVASQLFIRPPPAA